MFTSKLILRLGLLHRVTDVSQLKTSLPRVIPACCSLLKQRGYSTAADNTPPPRWVQLEPELEEVLVPRKLSVSPLESWLSLRYSLPPALEPALPEEETALLEEKVLPPGSVPVLEDDSESATPLSCRNVLKIRRRKMNRHKYKKLLKRRKFVRRKVLESRGKRKQKKFENDLKRICRRAGLKAAPEGWTAPKLFIKQHGNK
ncbi:aurora kinase A-interacting protein isoform X2 [Boleophthalmus pectinirostris]|uniref:aurora kinase A-interacting protein isoform X2 n=1 Tax=Boleophthalmus pectinirostris TaxID=150288 RepID=UPI00242D40AE|nr:aurora kinase A-interacting protein isoform X2 [Boleophthalmus pectinirostris]